MQPPLQRYQPNFDEIKTTLGLSEEQITQLKNLQQEKVTATQAFYTKMADKQKELNALLESNSADAAKVGQLMLELQQLRKQPAPSGTDVHDKAIAVLSADQKEKLSKIEEAQKLRSTVDQALQLGLLNPPPPSPRAMPMGGAMHTMGSAKPTANQ